MHFHKHDWSNLIQKQDWSICLALWYIILPLKSLIGYTESACPKTSRPTFVGDFSFRCKHAHCATTLLLKYKANMILFCKHLANSQNICSSMSIFMYKFPWFKTPYTCNSDLSFFLLNYYVTLFLFLCKQIFNVTILLLLRLFEPSKFAFIILC